MTCTMLDEVRRCSALITGIGAIMQPIILIRYYSAPFRLHEAVAVFLKQQCGHCQGNMY